MEHPIPTITAERNIKLRSPLYEAYLAEQIRPWGETANLVRDSICGEIADWHDDGRLIKAWLPKLRCRNSRPTPTERAPVTLDLARMEWTGELTVYDTKGRPMFVDVGVPLVSLEEAFRASSRRTLNRQFEKIGNPPKRSVKRSLLSLQLWEDVAVKMVAYRRAEIAAEAAE